MSLGINHVYMEAHTLIPIQFFTFYNPNYLIFIARLSPISVFIHLGMQKEVLHDKNIQITFTNYKFSTKQKTVTLE